MRDLFASPAELVEEQTGGIGCLLLEVSLLDGRTREVNLHAMDADPLPTRAKAQSPSESPFPRNLVTIATVMDSAHRRAEPGRRFQRAYLAGISAGGLPWGSRRCERSQSCRDRPSLDPN